MGERIGVDITNMVYDTCAEIVNEAINAKDFEFLNMELLRVLAIETPFDEKIFFDRRESDLAEMVFDEAIGTFKRKMDKLAATAFPVIKQVFDSNGERFKNILVPITDGKRVYNIATPLAQAAKTEGRELIRSFEKVILLHTIDDAWKEHLRELDDLRDSVQNASYEQKDPLLIYKLESFGLFKTMMDNINKKAVSILLRGQIPVQEPSQLREAAPERRTDLSRFRTRKEDVGSGGGSNPQFDTRERQVTAPIRVEKKAGRNDPCPCGSGKKYKNCHGQV
jgi:preprotein translocase subunit SecA